MRDTTSASTTRVNLQPAIAQKLGSNKADTDSVVFALYGKLLNAFLDDSQF